MRTLAKKLEIFQNIAAPVGTRDHSWLRRDEEQRQALDAFWSTLKNQQSEHMKLRGIDQADIDKDMDALSAASTEEHLSALAAEKEEILARIKAAASAKEAVPKTPARS